MNLPVKIALTVTMTFNLTIILVAIIKGSSAGNTLLNQREIPYEAPSTEVWGEHSIIIMQTITNKGVIIFFIQPAIRFLLFYKYAL